MVLLRELALDPLTGDLLIQNGELVILEGAEALAQRIAVRCKTFLGEWVFDTTLGTPWFQNILGTRRREALVQQILRKRVADTEGVAGVLELQVNINTSNRLATVTGRVLAEDGSEVPVSFEVGR